MKLETIISDLEKNDIKGSDVIRLSGNSVDVYTYEDIMKFQTLDQLLGNKKAAVVLYQTKQNFGHWVLIMQLKKDNGSPYIEFFDPYAFKIDEELKLSDYNIKMHGGKIIPYLSYLVMQSRLPIIMNNVRLQKFSHHVNTCGRHVAVRAKFRHINLITYAKMLTDNMAYNADFWVSALTLLS